MGLSLRAQGSSARGLPCSPPGPSICLCRLLLTVPGLCLSLPLFRVSATEAPSPHGGGSTPGPGTCLLSSPRHPALGALLLGKASGGPTRSPGKSFLPSRGAQSSSAKPPRAETAAGAGHALRKEHRGVEVTGQFLKSLLKAAQDSCSHCLCSCEWS